MDWFSSPSRFVRVQHLKLQGDVDHFLTQLMKEIELSSFTLTSLELSTMPSIIVAENKTATTGNRIPQCLNLPNLKQFSISTDEGNRVIHVFKCIGMLQTRRLEELRIVCTGSESPSLVEDIRSINEHDYNHFASIKRLKLDVPAIVYPNFLSRLPLTNIADLWIASTVSDEDIDVDEFVGPKEIERHCIKFPSLKKLGIWINHTGIKIPLLKEFPSLRKEEVFRFTNMFDFSASSVTSNNSPQRQEDDPQCLALRKLETLDWINLQSVRTLQIHFALLDYLKRDEEYLELSDTVLRSVKKLHVWGIDEYYK